MGILDKYSDDELFDILGSDVEEEIRSRGYEYGWHKKVTYPGSIYVLVNPAFPNLVKIGYADDVAKRVKSLNRNSGLPDPYHVYATYKVKKRLEDLRLHGLIDMLDPDLRHAKNREFYEMSADDAYALLSAIAQINGDEELLEKNPFEDMFFGEAAHEPVSMVEPTNEYAFQPSDKDCIRHEREFKYWTRYNELAHADEAFMHEFKPRSPRGQHWTSLATGVCDAEISLQISVQGWIGVEFYVANDKQLAYKAIDNLDVLSRVVGVEGVPFEAKKAAGVRLRRYGTDVPNKPEEWDGYIRWQMDAALKLKAALREIGVLSA